MNLQEKKKQLKTFKNYQNHQHIPNIYPKHCDHGPFLGAPGTETGHDKAPLLGPRAPWRLPGGCPEVAWRFMLGIVYAYGNVRSFTRWPRAQGPKEVKHRFSIPVLVPGGQTIIPSPPGNRCLTRGH